MTPEEFVKYMVKHESDHFCTTCREWHSQVRPNCVFRTIEHLQQIAYEVNKRYCSAINQEDHDFYDKAFEVSLAQIIPPVVVYADNEQDAIDIAADWHEKQGHMGLFVDPEDIEDEEEYYYLGNACHPVYSHEIYVKEI